MSIPTDLTVRRRARVSRHAALPLLGLIFAALMLGGTLPIRCTHYGRLSSALER